MILFLGFTSLNASQIDYSFYDKDLYGDFSLCKPIKIVRKKKALPIGQISSFTQHGIDRTRERNILVKDAKYALKKGEPLEKLAQDTVIKKYNKNKDIIVVCSLDEKKIITAYKVENIVNEIKKKKE